MNKERLYELADRLERMPRRAGDRAETAMLSSMLRRAADEPLDARDAIAKLVDRPGAFDMGVWLEAKKDWCGTVACIAGMAVLTWPAEYRRAGGEACDIADAARDILDLSETEAYELFLGRRPDQCLPLHVVAGIGPRKAAQACRNLADGKPLWPHTARRRTA